MKNNNLPTALLMNSMNELLRELPSLRATVLGQLGENVMNIFAAELLDKDIYCPFHDLIIPAPNGKTTQIDHIYVSQYGIFVVETKNYSGWIFGNVSQSQWTQIRYGKKYRIPNPVYQNTWHIKALSALLGLPEKAFHSCIVFTDEHCQIKTEMPPNIATPIDFYYFVQSCQRILLKPETKQRVYDILSNPNYQANSVRRTEHIAKCQR